MYLLYIIILLILFLLLRKKKIVETGYWGPWGYSEKYEWVYSDGYKAFIPYKKKYNNIINNSIYLPYEYWL